MVLRRTACIWLLLSVGVFGAGRLERPVLGYVYEPEGKTIRIVTGVPGAAVIEDSVANASKLERVFLAPGRKFAIASILDAPDLHVVTWAGPEAATIPLAGSGASATLVAIAGESAAIYYSGSVQVWRGLPDAPVAVRRFDAPDLRAIAISQDGSAVAGASAGGVTVWSGDEKRVVASGDFTSLAYLPESDVLLGLDAGRLMSLTQELLLIADVPGARILALSADGAHAAIGSDKSVAIVELGSRTVLGAELEAESLHALNQPGVFIATSPKGERWVVDTGSGVLRIVLAAQGGAE